MSRRRNKRQKRGTPSKRDVANKFRFEYGAPFLTGVGPLIPCRWHVPRALEDGLALSGRVVPAPVAGAILLDTGAGSTCISQAAAQALQLKPHDRVQTYGAGGLHTNDRVFAALELVIEDRGVQTRLRWEMPCQSIPEMDALGKATGVRVGGQDVALVGLLGRDILSKATVIYNGKKGAVEVTFDRDWVRGTVSFPGSP